MPPKQVIAGGGGGCIRTVHTKPPKRGKGKGCLATGRDGTGREEGEGGVRRRRERRGKGRFLSTSPRPQTNSSRKRKDRKRLLPPSNSRAQNSQTSNKTSAGCCRQRPQQTHTYTRACVTKQNKTHLKYEIPGTAWCSCLSFRNRNRCRRWSCLAQKCASHP